MAKVAIPETIRQQVEGIVDQFNKTELKGRVFYAARFRGKHLYLDHTAYGRTGPICRLTYTGAIDKWEFAIYKYSDNAYDPSEWFFPGSGHVDGTIVGAMRAGMAAYPA
jgi:hypothetical protein